MPISEKQKKILTFPFQRDYRALICDGAVRSGKTSLMTVAFVNWAMREFCDMSFAICGKTIASAVKNIIHPYMALTVHRGRYEIAFRRSENLMVVRQGERVNRFYVYGGKDESSYALIQGITLGGVFLDEVALMTRSFVEEALARCLTVPNRRYWFSCNPDNPSHWFYKEWILRPEKHRALYLHFLMSDNPAMGEDAILQAERDFSGVFYERKVLGRWAVTDGLVYPMFAKERHVAAVAPRCSEYRVSIDYGTYNPFHALLWGLSDGVWYCVREYRYSGRDGLRKDPTQYYAELEGLMGDRPVSHVIVDPSADAFITLLRNRGRRVLLADNRVLAGIECVSTCLNKGLIQICEGCGHLIDEFGLYSWDGKSGGDRPLKEHDHGMDALRYFALTGKLTQTKRKYL